MRTVPLHRAFVLHSRPYGETSLLVEAFSARFGRVGLMAKGARRAKSRWRGLVQPFRPLLLCWLPRKELGLLTGIEAQMPFPLLVGRAVLCGFYLNELLLRLLPRDDPLPQLFEHYMTAVRDLAEQPREEPVLRIFEKHLLDALGYGLTLDRDVQGGQEIDPDAVYDYRLDSGPVRTPALGLVELPIGGRTLLALGRGQVHNPTELAEAKRLLRLALERQLGEKPLISRRLFRQPGVRRFGLAAKG